MSQILQFISFFFTKQNLNFEMREFLKHSKTYDVELTALVRCTFKPTVICPICFKSILDFKNVL